MHTKALSLQHNLWVPYAVRAASLVAHAGAVLVELLLLRLLH